MLRILVAVLVATSYPLQVHPARKCMSSLSAKLIALYNAKGSESVDETLRQFSSLEDDNPSTSRLSSKLFIQIRYVAFTVNRNFFGWMKFFMSSTSVDMLYRPYRINSIDDS